MRCAPDFEREPHLRQCGGECAFHPFHELARVLPPNAPRLAYEPVPPDERSTRHWGQRKLMLAEVEFLTLCAPASALVVYAGAAPGTHIGLLAQLFPGLRFLCVDPRPFLAKSSAQVELRQCFFTAEMAAQLGAGSGPVLLISDVRTADPRVQGSLEAVEEAVASDQAMQMDWVMLMRPLAYMLKFRLPWTAGTTRYLRGDVHLPIWGRATTTETRLICRGLPEFVDYDNKLYEEQLFYFNRVTRAEYHDHPTDLGEDTDHCYDCAAEDLVLRQYLAKSLGREPTSGETRALSRRISHGCVSRQRPGQRQKWFRPTLFDSERGTAKEWTGEAETGGEDAFGEQVARDLT